MLDFFITIGSVFRLDCRVSASSVDVWNGGKFVFQGNISASWDVVFLDFMWNLW